MTHVLLVESANLDVHRLRGESRKAGLSLLYECARSSAELKRLLLKRRGVVVVYDLQSTAALPLEELLQMTAQAGVPLVLVGGDTPEERTVLANSRGRYAASLRRSRFAWLPMVLDRLGREIAEPDASGNAVQRSTVDAPAERADVSEQMRRVQKLALVGRLSVSIAHEINNPLEAITNLAYLISSDAQMPEHLRPYLRLVEQELARVGQITKRTLSFHREGEKPEPVLLSELLDEVLVLYARRLEEKRVEVERQYGSEDLLTLMPGEMRQVYANLIANAIEASGAGGRILVRVRKARRYRAGTRQAVPGVRVTIADGGSGISAEAQAKLGQLFYTTKGERGTGLGLWVSQAIVQRCQGTMRLRSSVGPGRHGTTFSIFLPKKKIRPRVVEIGRVGRGAAKPAPLEEVRLRAGTPY